MGYHIRIETKKIASFQTTRTRNSELWLVNRKKLEDAILGYAARYTTRHEVDLYALALEGNHTHNAALFPKANRAHFMRDFNSSVARAVNRYQEDYPGGKLWHRRYSSELLPTPEDIENWFFYIVLQPVQDGLVADIKDYPGYNCFEDAVTGTSRTYQVVNWKAYNDARRWRKHVSINDFTDSYSLKFKRLPGYEHLSQEAYATMMRSKLRKRTEKILEERGPKPFMGVRAMSLTKPGARPNKTKVSGPNDHRPRVLSLKATKKREVLSWYFDTQHDYKSASKRYRGGDLDVKFPPGTYKPPLFTVAYSGSFT
jgi:hypothetical protein